MDPCTVQAACRHCCWAWGGVYAIPVQCQLPKVVHCNAQTMWCQELIRAVTSQGSREHSGTNPGSTEQRGKGQATPVAARALCPQGGQLGKLELRGFSLEHGTQSTWAKHGQRGCSLVGLGRTGLHPWSYLQVSRSMPSPCRGAPRCVPTPSPAQESEASPPR